MSTSKTAHEIVAKQDMMADQLDIGAAVRARIAAHMASEIDKAMLKEAIRRERQNRLTTKLRAHGVDVNDAVAIAKKLLP